jgi:nicotinamidase-related amidase
MAGVPTIYVNDNFGQWRHDFRSLITHCLETSCNGRSIVELLRPHGEDYFVLKPKHSGFFATALELLLKYLKVRHLIVTGMAGNNCVLYTAADAYMRDFTLYVPEDCTASLDESSNRFALEHMKSTLKVDTRPSAHLDFLKSS